MNGKTARLINKAASRRTWEERSDEFTTKKPLGRRTRSFWGGVWAAWEKLKKISPALAAASPPPPPPKFAHVIGSVRTQARKAIKRNWKRETARERSHARARLIRELHAPNAHLAAK